MMHGSIKVGLLIGLCVLLSQCCPCCPAAMKGDLTAKRAQVTWTPANQSARAVGVGEHVSVGAGDGIGVDASGLAVLEFPDLQTVEIYRDSTLEVRDASSQDGSPLVDLYLALGAIFASTQPGAESRLRVGTESATVESLTTEFLVMVDPNTQTTLVIVSDGEVRVSGAGQAVVVRANQYTAVSPGQPPSPPAPFDAGTFKEWVGILRDGEIPWRQPTRIIPESPIAEAPDLVVVSLLTTGAATVNPDGNIEVPIRVVVRNQGNVAADTFKVSTEYTGPDGTFAVAFTVPGQDNVWYPYTSAPLAAEDEVTFTGAVTFPPALQGQEVSLRALADSCAGDEFMPDYCRVQERDEGNNGSDAISISLP